MNMLPWGGPTTRAATALQVGATELFVPVIPAMIAGLAGVFVFGDAHRARTSASASRSGRTRFAAEALADSAEAAASVHETASAQRFGRLWYFNALLTALTLTVLFLELVPLALVFMIASAIALVVNYPDSHAQRERLTSHGAAAMMMVTTIFAAGVFTGVLTKSGMLASMTSDLVCDPAGGRAAALAAHHGGRVDAAQPGLRSGLVLLRTACRSWRTPPTPRAAPASRSRAARSSAR